MSDHFDNRRPKHLPAVSEQGELMGNVGKYARSCVLTAFEMIGGVDAMAKWAEENPGDFYTKVFTKTITKEVETRDVTSVEDLLDKLDQGVIDVTPDEVHIREDFEEEGFIDGD